MSTVSDVLGIAIPLIDLGSKLLQNQLSKRDAALQAASIALGVVPIEELKAHLTEADRARAELGYEVAATLAFGPREP